MDLPITTAASSPRPTPSPVATATPSASLANGLPVFASSTQPLSPFSLASAASLPPAIIERRPSLSASFPPPAPLPAPRASARGVSASSTPTPNASSLPPPASASGSTNGAPGSTNMNGNHVATSASSERPLYAPSNILITGGAGFIGSNVMLYLLGKYPHYRIVCLDKLEYCATVNNFADIADHPNFTFIKGDICSLDLVNLVLSSYRIDTILHFAAQTHVDNSFGLALDFTRTNIFGTHVLLEAIKHIQPQIRRFIHVSTDEVYGSSLLSAPTRLTEDSQLNPSNPYAATKVAAEYLVRSYAHSFGVPSIITRGNNVYGPRQYPEKLIPKFIHLLERRQPCPLHGDGQNRRSYLYVDDVSRAFDVILHRGEVGTIYNVGSDVEISNLEVFRALLRAFGERGKAEGGGADGGGGRVEGEERYVQFVRDRPYNDLRYFIDTSSLQQLGWRKEVGWEDGIARTMQWYMHNKQHWGDIGEGALAAHPRVEIKVAAEKE